MPVIPDPTRPISIGDDVIINAAAVDMSFMPDMVYDYHRSTAKPPTAPTVEGKYIARIAAGVNARETPDPVLQKIGNRVAYTCVMPKAATVTITLSSMLKLFIHDPLTNTDKVLDNCEVVSIDPGGSFAWRSVVICIQ